TLCTKQAVAGNPARRLFGYGRIEWQARRACLTAYLCHFCRPDAPRMGTFNALAFRFYSCRKHHRDSARRVVSITVRGSTGAVRIAREMGLGIGCGGGRTGCVPRRVAAVGAEEDRKGSLARNGLPSQLKPRSNAFPSICETWRRHRIAGHTVR